MSERENKDQIQPSPDPQTVIAEAKQLLPIDDVLGLIDGYLAGAGHVLSELREKLNELAALPSPVTTSRLSARWQELFWALPSGEMRHKLRALEIDTGRLIRGAALPSPASSPQCQTCGKPATCRGSYEGHEDPPQYACDDCCGHGNEDGWCKPVPSPASSQEWQFVINEKQARMIVEYFQRGNHRDHGCRVCRPGLDTDFVCVEHQLIAALPASPPPEAT